MNKTEFINALKEELKSLSKDDQKEITEDYELHIEEKLQDGEEEEVVIKNLGDPKEIAKEHILELTGESKKEITRGPNVSLFILVQVANLLFVFWIIFALLMAIFSFFISAGAIFVTSFSVFIIGNDFTALEKVSYFISSIGFSILFWNLALVLSSKAFWVLKKYFKWNISLLRGEKI